MDNLINVFANDDKDDNQLNEKKPPPRVCPRCSSNNTKFCYFNNYSVSQPRYFCKNCRRYWTHGGALRNIPIGGSGRKSKRAKVDHQSSVSHMVSVENQPIINHQLSGSFCGHSSTNLGNTFDSLSDIAHGVTNVSPVRSFRPMDRLDFPDDLFQQGYFDLGLNDFIGDPLINQPIGGYVDNHNGYRINHVDQPEWNQSFMSNTTMNMNHMASARKMNMNNNNIRNSCLFRSTRQLE